MRLLISIIAIIIFSALLQMVSPWWMLILPVAVITGYAKLGSGQGFLAGFIGIAIVWAVYATMLNSGNDGILAARIGKLFGGLSPILLILTTAIVGGLIGGLAGMTGSLGRKLIG